jgi:hypothetical protein
VRWHTYGISVEGRFIYPQEIKFVFDDPLAFADGFFQLKAVQDFDRTGGCRRGPGQRAWRDRSHSAARTPLLFATQQVAPATAEGIELGLSVEEELRRACIIIEFKKRPRPCSSR